MMSRRAAHLTLRGPQGNGVIRNRLSHASDLPQRRRMFKLTVVLNAGQPSSWPRSDFSAGSISVRGGRSPVYERRRDKARVFTCRMGRMDATNHRTSMRRVKPALTSRRLSRASTSSRSLHPNRRRTRRAQLHRVVTNRNIRSHDISADRYTVGPRLDVKARHRSRPRPNRRSPYVRKNRQYCDACCKRFVTRPKA